MLVSAAGTSRPDVDFSEHIRLVEVGPLDSLYPTVSASGDVRVTREPDPLTCVPAMGWTLHGVWVVLCVSRCTFHPAYAVFASSTATGKFARAAGGAVTYTDTVDQEDDAYWWLVSDASGGVFNASRALFPSTPPYTPRAFSPIVVQPASAAIANHGTRLGVRGCKAVYAPPTECDLARQGAAPCTACNHLPPALCAHVAQLGACGTAFGALCAVTCAVHGGTHRADSAALRLLATDAKTVRPKVVPSSPMFMRTRAPLPRDEPQIEDLTRVLATQRWSSSPGTDPAVGVANEKVARWTAPARRYFWAVLTAMTVRRLDGPGACWFADAHGGFTRSGPLEMEATSGFRTGMAMPARTCGAMCAGTDRLLSYYGMLDLCDDADWKRRWAACADEMARRAGFTRTRNSASCGTEHLVLAVGDGAKGIDRAMRAVSSPTAKARLRALITQDYTALSWSGVQAMFRLTAEELGVLKAAVAEEAPSSAGPRSRWRDLPASLRLRLIEQWNAGALFAFAEKELGPASLVLRMPKQTPGGSAPTQHTLVASHFPFQHAFWPSDRVSATGRNVATRDADGNYGAAVPRTCLRCPSSAPSLRSAVETESVACTPFGAADGKPEWRRCLASAHSRWREHPTEAAGDGSYYEDDGAVAFLHGVHLADGLTDPTGVGARERVRLCDAKRGWSNTDGFPWAAYRPYSNDPPPPMTWNPFRVTAAHGRPVRLFNDMLRGVQIPPGYAVYVTPHYHGFHASGRTCHHGVPHVRGTPGAPGVLDPTKSKEPFFSHVLQCRSASWTPHLKEHPRGPEPHASQTPGVILVNDDLGSVWTVEPGDNLNDAGELTFVSGGKAEAKADLFFPSHVNCVAAWNFFAYPRHWLQRSNVDPYDGDAIPSFDAVAFHNNVRTTSDSLLEFFEHSRSLNVRVVLRTGSVPTKG